MIDLTEEEQHATFLPKRNHFGQFSLTKYQVGEAMKIGSTETSSKEAQMKRSIIFAAVFGWISSLAPAMAQTSVDSVTSGHEKLALFVGKWAAEADFKPSKTSSGGKSKWTEACEWLEGSYALLCHSEGEFGGHPVKEISVMAYDASQKSYVYFETNSSDEIDLWRGKVEGDTWTWSEKSMAHGKPSEMRFTQRFSADSVAFKLESAVGDAPFNVVMDGKQIRQK